MNLHRVTIKGDGPTPQDYRVLLDGEPVKGLRALTLEMADGDINSCTITLMSDEVEVEGTFDVLTGDDAEEMAEAAETNGDEPDVVE